MNELAMITAASMTSREIAELTGKTHGNVVRDIRVMLEQLEAESNLIWHCESTTYVDAQGKERPMYRLDRDTTYCLVSGYDAAIRMRVIQRWQELERHLAAPQPPTMSLPRQSLVDAMYVVEQAQRILRLSATSTHRMMGKALELEGMSSTVLPAYIDETLVRSLTSLLQEVNAPFNAREANQILISLGILEELERVSSRGTMKTFKSITDMGLTYGRNETSPSNPRETQPLYYVAKFPELYNLMVAQHG